MENLETLRCTPADIEAGLRHCTTQEQCDGCPFADVHGYCGQILNEQALAYIEILKYLNRTLAQELERREDVAEKFIKATTADMADSK